jgi:hypothetical protein
MIFSLSGFKSTNILRMNSLAAMASLCGPAKYTSENGDLSPIAYGIADDDIIGESVISLLEITA